MVTRRVADITGQFHALGHFRRATPALFFLQQKFSYSASEPVRTLKCSRHFEDASRTPCNRTCFVR